MGISGFEPLFLVGVDAVRSEHGSRLAALAGRRLTGFAVVRFGEGGRWFADGPVVLDFAGVQVEVCHSRLDELSIGWNSIDTAAAITGWWEWAEAPPLWSARDERLEAFVGWELREVRLLEWRPGEHDPAAGTVAVEFVFPEDRLRIINYLDENGLEAGASKPGYVQHRLVG